MVPRDEEEYERRRQQIIDGALAVFSAKGFDKATNQEIAEAAGIGSPGLIYHYFENKMDLLRQAVASRAPLMQDIVRDDILMGKTPRDALRLIGSAFFETLYDLTNLQLFRVIIAEALRNQAMADEWHQTGTMPAKRVLTRYLDAEMRAGKLKPVDPEAAANCFLGSFLLYTLTNEVFGRSDAQKLARQTMLETTVSIFLEGLEVE